MPEPPLLCAPPPRKHAALASGQTISKAEPMRERTTSWTEDSSDRAGEVPRRRGGDHGGGQEKMERASGGRREDSCAGGGVEEGLGG